MGIIKSRTLILLALPCLFACSSPDKGKMLIGKWEFMKFYTDGETTRELQAEMDEYKNLNKGLTIRFSPSGEYESDQPGGIEENNLIADYKVIDGDKLVIERDTLRIIEVDESFLKLFKDHNSPNVIYRRINSTGTEPGRR